jgi:hypothetical protein
MKNRGWFYTILCVLAFFSVSAPRLYRLDAMSLESLEFRAGVLWIGNAYTVDADGDPVQGSDVSPLRFSPGFAARLRVNPYLAFVPGIDFYWQEYLDPDDHDKVVPTQIETGPAVGDLAGTLGVVLSAPLQLDRQVGEAFVLGAGLSPTLAFRLPVIPIEGSEVEGIGSYFISDGRFLYPELQLFGKHVRSDTLRFGVLSRILFPVYNLWVEPSLPFWDEMMIYTTLTIEYVLPGPEQ